MNFSKYTLLAGAMFSILASQCVAESLPTSVLDVSQMPGKPIWGGSATITPMAFDAQKKPSIVVIRIPAGTAASSAHATSDGSIRFATVLSGTMFYSDGETVEHAKEVGYAPGSVLLISSGTKHWLSARESDVTLMLTVVAPDKLSPFVMQQHQAVK